MGNNNHPIFLSVYDLIITLMTLFFFVTRFVQWEIIEQDRAFKSWNRSFLTDQFLSSKIFWWLPPFIQSKPWSPNDLGFITHQSNQMTSCLFDTFLSILHCLPIYRFSQFNTHSPLPHLSLSLSLSPSLSLSLYIYIYIYMCIYIAIHLKSYSIPKSNFEKF